MDIHDRLEAFFDYCHLSKNKVQEEVGLPSGTFSKKPKNGFRTDTIRKIAEKYPQLNTDWLITGKGEMIIDGEQPQAALINAGLRERLAAFIESLGISQNEFARSCGLAQGLVSRITDNAQESTFQKIQSRYPQLNMYWLRTGEGQMLDEQPQAHPDFSTYSERVIYVPLVSQYAHGGYISGFADEEYLKQLPVIPFIVEQDARGRYIAFEVRGDSMDDGTRQSYAQGDIVLSREVEKEMWDVQFDISHTDFVIVMNDGIIFKRIISHDVLNHKITVHSFNPIFDDMVIDLADIKQIFSVILKQQKCRR
ncbi:MAG: LexA family transcriptional regulator [Prevotella sp.]|nr:LexA family transcriptional regulator [Prevotella sp.]